MELLRKFLQQDKKISIYVVGDAMLDEYFYVSANRISPEFPILIAQTKSEIPDLIRPGGAANVCYQFKDFNVYCKLFSIVDYGGYPSFFKRNFDPTGCFMPHKSIMPRKKRYYNNEFPLYRWDVEEYGYGLNEQDLIRARKIVHNDFMKSTCDVVILSDYNKGLFSEDIRWIRDNVITIVDPKKGPLHQWTGCTVFKPNKKEAFELSGEEDWLKQVDFFENELKCKAVVITQGEEGVVGKCDGDYFSYKSPVHGIPSNYMGAGDCFAAFLGMALGYGMSILEAVEVACDISSIYVQKSHNELVTKRDILALLDPFSVKFMTAEELVNRDYSLVFTNGCFDIFHAGHLATLKSAKSFGDKLCVGLNSDRSVSLLKGKDRPIHNLQQRKELLASFEFVDFIIDFDEETPLELIKKLNPEVLVKGGDYEVNDVVGKEYAKEVKIVPFLENLSTTRILDIFSDEF